MEGDVGLTLYVSGCCHQLFITCFVIFSTDELADLIEQLGEGGRNAHELEKARKRLEMEKEELAAALEEARLLLEAEEAKVARAHLEVVQAKQESDRRIIEKEEEIEQLRQV